MCSIEIDACQTTFFVEANPKQTVAEALISNGIPPSSVVMLAEGEPVSSTHRIRQDIEYKAIQLENYELENIRSLYHLDSEKEGLYLDRRISISPDGDIINNMSVLSSEEFRLNVERTLIDSIKKYDLISRNENILFGLSGGIDSIGLLVALSNIRDHLPDFNLEVVTVEETWSEGFREEIELAKAATEKLNIEHHIQEEETVKSRYGFTCTVEEAIKKVSESQFSPHTVGITDHIVTREIESFVQKDRTDAIFLASHTTDVVERFIDPMSKDDVSRFPENKFGYMSFRYPGIYLTKKQLSLYLHTVYGLNVCEQFRESWINQTEEESFLYYIADILQWCWPGIEYWIVESGSNDYESEPVKKCSNCGKVTKDISINKKGECTCCNIFRALNVIN